MCWPCCRRVERRNPDQGPPANRRHVGQSVERPIWPAAPAVSIEHPGRRRDRRAEPASESRSARLACDVAGWKTGGRRQQDRSTGLKGAARYTRLEAQAPTRRRRGADSVNRADSPPPFPRWLWLMERRCSTSPTRSASASSQALVYSAEQRRKSAVESASRAASKTLTTATDSVHSRSNVRFDRMRHAFISHAIPCRHERYPGFGIRFIFIH